MAEEIAFKIEVFPTFFQGLMIMTFDRVLLHTVMHHSSTSTYMPNLTEIEETFCGCTDGRLRPTLSGQLF